MRTYGILCCILLSANIAHTAILVENGESVRTEVKIANTATEMRGVRRVGLGTVFGGVAGIAGLNLEINFTRHAAVFGWALPRS